MTQREPEPGWGTEDVERKNEEEEPDPRVKRQGRPEAEDVPPPSAKPTGGDAETITGS
jgi:hypothetical protein